MRYAADLVYHPESLSHMRRALEGTCWAIGIAVDPKEAEPLHVQAARRAAVRAILESAAAGTREVQALKQAALHSLRTFLARSFRLSAA